MRAFLSVLRAQFTLFFRDRLDLFFTLVFPLTFVFLFGFLWGSPGRAVRVGFYSTAPVDLISQVLADFPELAVRDFPSAQDLENAVARRIVDFGIVWDGSSLVFLFDRGRVQDNVGFEGQARRIARSLELRRAGATAPIQAEKLHVGKLQAATWFHYIVPGLMAMALIQAGVFAVAGRMASMRERGVLRRMLATPLPGWALLLGVGSVRLSVGFLSAGLTLLGALTVFGLAFSLHPGWLFFYAVVSSLGAMGLGALVSAVARKPGSAAAAGMILVQAMLFLSGIYIPFEFLPPALRLVGRALPAHHMAQGMRAALGVIEGTSASVCAGLGFGAFGLSALLLFGRALVRPERGWPGDRYHLRRTPRGPSRP